MTREIEVVVTFQTTFVGVPDNLGKEELLDYILPKLAGAVEGKLPKEVLLFEDTILINSTKFKLTFKKE